MSGAIESLTSVLPVQTTDLADAKALGSAAESKDVQAAKDFESLLLHKLLQEMAATVDESPLLGDATTKQVKDMYWYYLAQDLADKGGLGLWKQIAARQQYAAAQQPQQETGSIGGTPCGGEE